MSTDYGLDNEGTGFDFDDDEDDFDALIAEATAAAGPDNPEDADTSVLFADPTTAPAPPAPVEEEEEEPEPEPEPKRARRAPAAKAEARPATQPRMNIPTTEEEIAHVDKVIRILDAIRRLNAGEKSVVSQFITGGQESTSEAELVIATINVDSMLPVTMETLREAKAQEPVDRAFYIMDLSDTVLYSLGSLVAVFTNEEGDRHGSRSDYARVLVRNIEKLEQKAMGFVNATEGVLRAAAAEGK